MTSSKVRRWRSSRPLDLTRTLGPLVRGTGDPCTRFVAGVAWRASTTPEGAATVAVTTRADEIEVRSWGPGAEWILDGAPDLLGESDDWSGLDLSAVPLLREVRRRFPGVRLCRTGLVLDSLLPACLEQRVTGREARGAWRQLVRRCGQPAPGPAPDGMFAPPTAEVVLGVADWDWHRWGVDPRRYRTIRSVAMVAPRLEEAVTLSAGRDAGSWATAARRLTAVPGVGVWTAAETCVRALGDPDAVSVGDFHLKNLVGWVLTGAARSDDDAMLELLAPWAGQRARVVRLIELSGLTPPKFGPRFHANDISRI